MATTPDPRETPASRAHVSREALYAYGSTLEDRHGDVTLALAVVLAGRAVADGLAEVAELLVTPSDTAARLPALLRDLGPNLLAAVEAANRVPR